MVRPSRQHTLISKKCSKAPNRYHSFHRYALHIAARYTKRMPAALYQDMTSECETSRSGSTQDFLVCICRRVEKVFFFYFNSTLFIFQELIKLKQQAGWGTGVGGTQAVKTQGVKFYSGVLAEKRKTSLTASLGNIKEAKQGLQTPEKVIQ